MLICFISDIHGNEVAFDQCLKWINYIAPDEVYFLGDAIGYFPSGEAVVKKLCKNKIICQMGNHEKMFFESGKIEKDKIYKLDSLRKRMSPDVVDEINNWPIRRELIIEGKTLLLVHGSPDNELEDYIYPDSFHDSFFNKQYDIILMGHTHHPFLKSKKGKLIVNVGSVGLPRDYGQFASMAIYETKTDQCKIIRFQIDIEKIVSLYGTSIHESVLSTLGRKADKIVGEMIK